MWVESGQSVGRVWALGVLGERVMSAGVWRWSGQSVRVRFGESWESVGRVWRACAVRRVLQVCGKTDCRGRAWERIVESVWGDSEFGKTRRLVMILITMLLPVLRHRVDYLPGKRISFPIIPKDRSHNSALRGDHRSGTRTRWCIQVVLRLEGSAEWLTQAGVQLQCLGSACPAPRADSRLQLRERRTVSLRLGGTGGISEAVERPCNVVVMRRPARRVPVPWRRAFVLQGRCLSIPMPMQSRLRATIRSSGSEGYLLSEHMGSGIPKA